MLFKIQTSEKDEPQSQFSQLNQTTIYLTLFTILAISHTTNIQQTFNYCFLFSEYFTGEFNCSLGVQYSSL